MDAAANLPRVKSQWPKDSRAARVRSRVTNGSSLYLTLRTNGSPSARRLRDLLAAHAADLGGIDNLTTAELVLIRRAAQLALQLELMEEKWALRRAGEASLKDLHAYQRATNSLRRVLETLGLERRSRNVSAPSVKDYIAHINAEQQEEPSG
jgi:hypothetical protein